MTMTALEYDTVQMGAAVCRLVLNDVLPKLQGLQQVYDSAGGGKESITQDELNEQPSLSNLTKTQLDDAIYVLTATLLPAITAAYPQLAQLAARSRGSAALPMSAPMLGL